MSLGLLVGLTLPATPLAEHNPIGRNSALRNGSRGGLATLRRNDNTAQLALQVDAGRRRHADRKRSYRPSQQHLTTSLRNHMKRTLLWTMPCGFGHDGGLPVLETLFQDPWVSPCCLKKHSLFASKFSLFRVQGISLAVPCECWGFQCCSMAGFQLHSLYIPGDQGNKASQRHFRCSLPAQPP